MLNGFRSAAAHRLACALVPVTVWGLLAGCNAPEMTTKMPVLDQAHLRQRALDFLHRAARGEIDVVASNAIESLVEIDPEGAARHFRAALTSEIAMIRFAGCVALGDIRDCGAAKRIRKRLTDTNEQVRLGAAFALFICGDRQQGHLLRRALRDGSDENIRATAAMLMGRIGEPPAVHELRLAADDDSTMVNMQALASMALLGDDESIDRLIQYAQGETIMRILALSTMVELADERTTEALLYRLRLKYPDEYLQHRLVAARALGRLGRNDGYELAMKSLSFGPHNAPSEMSADEKREEVTRVRSLAALALGDIGDERALSVLEYVAKTADDSRLQIAASAAICNIIPDPMGPPRRRARARPSNSIADRPRTP